MTYVCSYCGAPWPAFSQPIDDADECGECGESEWALVDDDVTSGESWPY